jgi:hypothetical protein
MLLGGEEILWELAALGAYVLYIYFSYCDGFGLKPGRKLIWGVCFLSVAYMSYRLRGHFDLKIILFVSSLLAFALARLQRHENLMKQLK